jgi:hypothetical protein
MADVETTMTREEQVTRDFEDMFTPAELHSDLALYLTTGEPFSMLRHPLVFGVPYSEEMNNFYNKRYALMSEEIEKAINEGAIHRYVFMHERPYRLDAFVKCIANRVVSDTDYWELLGSAWIDSENIWQNQTIWRRLLKSPRPHKHTFMDEDDRKAFKALPSQLTVYRGCRPGQNEAGMSWTLDRDKAVWFSIRYKSKGTSPHVLERTISKRKAFAYLGGRNESEIIIL